MVGVVIMTAKQSSHTAKSADASRSCHHGREVVVTTEGRDLLSDVIGRIAGTNSRSLVGLTPSSL
jgi:hypothetical protein